MKECTYFRFSIKTRPLLQGRDVRVTNPFHAARRHNAPSRALNACNVAAGLPTPDAKGLYATHARSSGAMFAPLSPPAHTCPGSLLAFIDATLSVIACDYYYKGGLC